MVEEFEELKGGCGGERTPEVGAAAVTGEFGEGEVAIFLKTSQVGTFYFSFDLGKGIEALR